MLYKFKSDAAGDLIMLEPAGRRVLDILGKDPSPQGIVTVEQLPAAIAALQAAVQADDAAFAERVAQAQAEGAPTPVRESVTLRQRAAPMLKLMERSLQSKADVVWGV